MFFLYTFVNTFPRNNLKYNKNNDDRSINQATECFSALNQTSC